MQPKVLQCCSSCHVCKLQISLWTKNQTNPWRSAYTLSHRHPTLSHTHTHTNPLAYAHSLTHAQPSHIRTHTPSHIYTRTHYTGTHHNRQPQKVSHVHPCHISATLENPSPTLSTPLAHIRYNDRHPSAPPRTTLVTSLLLTKHPSSPEPTNTLLYNRHHMYRVTTPREAKPCRLLSSWNHLLTFFGSCHCTYTYVS